MLLISLAVILILGPPLTAAARRMGLPSSVGYIAMGVALGTVVPAAAAPTPEFASVFEALASLGIVALLFRVGLRSHTSVLLKKLPEASSIWLVSVAFSLAVGFAVARYALHWSVATSLVIATAFSATSVAVSASVWDEARRLDSDEGQLLIDVAELDDLSAAVLLALLLGMLPAFLGGSQDVWSDAGTTVALILGKLALFIGGCYVFSHVFEKGFTRAICRMSDSEPGPTIAILGAGLAIAAIADSLGFSLAIGALFAGLAFSRDPDAVRTDGQFTYIYELLTPFFFVHIGMQTNLAALAGTIDLALLLFVAAALAKLIGTMAPALLTMGRRDALILSISMIPRAEIALVVLYACREVDPQIVTDDVFASMVLMSLATCVVAPIALRHLLNHPQEDR